MVTVPRFETGVPEHEAGVTVGCCCYCDYLIHIYIYIYIYISDIYNR